MTGSSGRTSTHRGSPGEPYHPVTRVGSEVAPLVDRTPTEPVTDDSPLHRSVTDNGSLTKGFYIVGQNAANVTLSVSGRGCHLVLRPRRTHSFLFRRIGGTLRRPLPETGRTQVSATGALKKVLQHNNTQIPTHNRLSTLSKNGTDPPRQSLHILTSGDSLTRRTPTLCVCPGRGALTGGTPDGPPPAVSREDVRTQS